VDENTNCHSSLFKLPLNRKSHQEWNLDPKEFINYLVPIYDSSFLIENVVLVADIYYSFCNSLYIWKYVVPYRLSNIFDSNFFQFWIVNFTFLVQHSWWANVWHLPPPSHITDKSDLPACLIYEFQRNTNWKTSSTLANYWLFCYWGQKINYTL
jgi:hypothetical protein